jgi:hypothetical protein
VKPREQPSLKRADAAVLELHVAQLKQMFAAMDAAAHRPTQWIR